MTAASIRPTVDQAEFRATGNAGLDDFGDPVISGNASQTVTGFGTDQITLNGVNMALIDAAGFLFS